MVLTVPELELLFVLLIVCVVGLAVGGVLVRQPPFGGWQQSAWREAQKLAEALLDVNIKPQQAPTQQAPSKP